MIALRTVFARLFVLAAVVPLALAQNKPIPQIVKTGGKYNLLVDGKPFIILGGPGQ